MPEWNVLNVVDASHDDDALFPTLSAPGDVYPVELGRADGKTSYFNATSVRVQQPGAKGLTNALQLPSDLKWEVLITDTRLLVYCVKFDKGGGWWGIGGGAVFALGANAISKARAAHRRKGKVLVGQIRYPWLQTVGATPKTGWKNSDAVRLSVDAQPGGAMHRRLYLTLALPKQLDAATIAHQISVRCAKYRLAQDPSMTPDEREKFEAIAVGQKKQPVTEKLGEPAWAWYPMPTSYRVNAATAKPKNPLSGEGVS